MPYQPDSRIKLNFDLSAKEAVEIPDEVLETMKGELQKGLSELKLLASSTENKSRRAEILITSYRIRHNAARLLVGAMAGCDRIISNVKVVDSVTEEVVGESVLSYKECAAWGVASQVIGAYTESIVEYLAGK